MPRLTGRLARAWRAELGDHAAALAWSPDGRRLAAAAVSGPAAVYDADTGEVTQRLAGHRFGATAVAWFGGDLATAGQDGRVRVWDAATGGERLALDAGADWAERLAVSPCGTHLASAAGRAVRLWDRGGRLVREYAGHASTVTDLAWRPGDAALASSAYGGVRVWSPGNGEPVRQFDWKGSVLRLAWSPDGRYLATGDQDSTVHFWVYATGQDLQMFGYPTKVRELAWDAGGRYLATGGGCQVTVWDCSGKGPEGTTPHCLAGHDEESAVSALAYQRAGPLLASGGGDGRVFLWQPGRSKKPLAWADVRSGVTQLAWGPGDGLLAAGCEDGGVVAFRA